MKEKDSRDILDLIVRYGLIILLGLGNLYIFYEVFRPLTVGAVSFIVGLFVPVVMSAPDTLFINGIYFHFVHACIGGSAYYLLFILCMSCRGITMQKRVQAIIMSFTLLFVFNIFRVILMIVSAHEVYFTVLHWAFWYFLATAFVFIDWVIVSRRLKIETIPVYSDMVYLLESMSGKKGRKKK